MHGPIDPAVGVIKVEDVASGTPKAVVMNFACHPDVVWNNFEVSADYRQAEKQTVNAMTLTQALYKPGVGISAKIQRYETEPHTMDIKNIMDTVHKITKRF